MAAIIKKRTITTYNLEVGERELVAILASLRFSQGKALASPQYAQYSAAEEVEDLISKIMAAVGGRKANG